MWVQLGSLNCVCLSGTTTPSRHCESMGPWVLGESLFNPGASPSFLWADLGPLGF